MKKFRWLVIPVLMVLWVAMVLVDTYAVRQGWTDPWEASTYETIYIFWAAFFTVRFVDGKTT